MDIRQIYENVNNGDPITDSELKFAIKFFKKLESDLRDLGPIFRLADNEAFHVLQTLEGFALARKRR